MKSLICGILSLVCFIGHVAAQSGPETPPLPEAPALAANKSVSSTKISNDIQDNDEPMRSKTFSKTFAADKTDKIMLSNQFGSMQIKIWDKNEVRADIDIKAYSNNGEEAQKLLDDTQIEASKSGDQITFKTKLDQQGRNWGSGSRNGKKWRREVKINYIVYMPAENALTLSQTYGSVTMEDLEGALYAKVQYGDFVAGSLNNANNYISVQYGKGTIRNVNKATVKQQYGSGLSIASVGTLDLDAQYSGVNIGTIKGNATIKQQYGSGLKIGSVENITLNVQYSNVNLSTVKGNATIDQQYNNLTIGSVGKLELHSQYTSVNVGSLKGDGKFDMQYNNLTVGEITNGCQLLNVDGDYVGISLNFVADYNASVDVQTSYASFKYGDNVSAKSIGDQQHSTSKHYTGKIGSGGNATVKIKSDYGSVTFK